MMGGVKVSIDKTDDQLGDKLQTANKIIIFMNSKCSHELQRQEVVDRTTYVLEVKRVLNKKSLVPQLEEICHQLEVGVSRVFNRIEPLNKRGFPSLFFINDKLMPRDGYVKRLMEIFEDISKLTNLKNTMTEKAFYEVINKYVFIQHEVKHNFQLKPTFVKYTETEKIYRKLKGPRS